MIKLQSGKNFHNQIPTRKRRCLSIFFIRKTNIKWSSYISVDWSEKWLWKFFPIVVFSIFWKIDKQWRTLALIRCTSNILSKSCICARHCLHFWKVFSDFPESVLQLTFFELLMLQKINSMLFYIFDLPKTVNHLFRAFLSLQKN